MAVDARPGKGRGVDAVAVFVFTRVLDYLVVVVGRLLGRLSLGRVIAVRQNLRCAIW